MLVYKTPITDLFDDVVSGLPQTITIESITQISAGHYTLVVCDMLWLEPGRTITIGANNYVIVTIAYDPDTITLTGSVLPTGNSFSIYTTYFFHGTPIETSNELAQIKNASEKSPMIFMLEDFEEEFDDDETSAIERKGSYHLFALTQGNLVSWQPDEFWSNAVTPMSRLWQNFIEVLKANKRFETLDLKYKTKPMKRFGAYVTNKGVKASLFADNLSGVGGTLDGLQTYKADECATCDYPT